MRYRRLLMLGLIFGLPAVSQGEVLTFAFDGFVEHVGSDPLAPVHFEIGEPITYEYTFDTNAPYIGGDRFAALSATIAIGDDNFPIIPYGSDPPVTLRVQDSTLDIFGVNSSVTFPGLDRSRHGFVSVYLSTYAGNGITDWRPPALPPDLSRFSTTEWAMYIFGAHEGDVAFEASGVITRSYQVPDPTTAVFLVLAGVSAVNTRRRP